MLDKQPQASQQNSGTTPFRFEAPARVNLIGEHTDYSGGYVLPLAIPFTTVAEIKPSSRNEYSFKSASFSTERRMTPEDASEGTRDWSDYPVGVLRQLQALAIKPPPFELAFSGNIPVGSGLSSSASIEVATAIALLEISGRRLTAEEIALLCRRAENEFVGSPCGIMDQFVVTAARADHALLLNTRDLQYELLPLNSGTLAECRIVVVNSMVKHSIAGGDYGLRRREVEAGQGILRNRFLELRDLGDATLGQLSKCETEMSPASYRRCRHIISENLRVLEARDHLLAGDAKALGKVLTRAHASERDDFECSVEEIDFLVEEALKLPGCLGARLTGGGFGGCTVNLVQIHEVDSFRRSMQAAYLDRYGISPEIYECFAVDGAFPRWNTGQLKDRT